MAWVLGLSSYLVTESPGQEGKQDGPILWLKIPLQTKILAHMRKVNAERSAPFGQKSEGECGSDYV